MVIRSFITDRKVLLVLLLYILVLLLLDSGGGDIWLANKLYILQGQHWALQHHWLTENVLHRGARKLNYIFCAAVLLLTLYHLINRVPGDAKTVRSYIALSLSLIGSFALVAYLKAITNIACPWDLALFGGTEPYIHLFQHRPDYLSYQQCFPAGHASVGYAWVALFFFFQQQIPRWRYLGLAVGIVFGLILGIAQQLRGAHFLSHDVTTFILCLLCAKLCFKVVCSTPNAVIGQQH